jgi:hypothetical protein
MHCFAHTNTRVLIAKIHQPHCKLLRFMCVRISMPSLRAHHSSENLYQANVSGNSSSDEARHPLPHIHRQSPPLNIKAGAVGFNLGSSSPTDAYRFQDKSALVPRQSITYIEFLLNRDHDYYSPAREDPHDRAGCNLGTEQRINLSSLPCKDHRQDVGSSSSYSSCPPLLLQSPAPKEHSLSSMPIQWCSTPRPGWSSHGG